MRKLIVANWKMNPLTAAEARVLARKSDFPGAVICPPFIFLGEVGGLLKKADLGAQDASWEDQGAYTGEVSPLGLKRAGVKYVILGHSERRGYLGEGSGLINKKIKASLRVSLKVILCVGEPESVHRGGLAATVKFVVSELKADLKGIDKSRLIIAYEPIWAIGNGNSASPEEINKINLHIKKYLGKNIPILYGGSVGPENAKKFLREPLIDGLLVGGASLKPTKFSKICTWKTKI